MTDSHQRNQGIIQFIRSKLQKNFFRDALFMQWALGSARVP